jgi:hypothetical protein
MADFPAILGGVRDYAGFRILDGDAHPLQSLAGGAVDIHLGLLERSLRRDQRRFGDGQRVLRNQRVITGFRAELLFLLCDVERTLRQVV